MRIHLSAEFLKYLFIRSNPGYNDYSWTPATITGNSDVYYPSTSSEDMIFLTGEGGCTSSDSLEIVVNDFCCHLLTIQKYV